MPRVPASSAPRSLPSVTFTGRLAIAVGVGALLVGIFTELAGPLWIASLIAAAFAVSWWGGTPLQRLTLGTPASMALSEGETRVVDLEMTSGSWIPLLGLSAWARASGMQGRGASSLVGSGVQELSVAVRGLRRGHVSKWSVQLETSAPFGWLSHRRPLDVSTDVWVLPRARPVPRAFFEQLERHAARALEPSATVVADEGDFYGLREHRLGESERRVHPRLSARRGRKVLALHGAARTTPVHILLDGRLPQRHVGGLSAEFEELIRFVVGVVRGLRSRGTPVSLWDVSTGRPARCADAQASDERVRAALARFRVARTADEPAPPTSPVPGELCLHVLVHAGLSAPAPDSWFALQVGTPGCDAWLERGDRA